MLLELKRPAEALKEFEASQIREPNRFHGFAGAARAAAESGDANRQSSIISGSSSSLAKAMGDPKSRAPRRSWRSDD
jgi:hypothetical protein